MATHGSGSAFPTAALVCAMRAEATRLGIDPDLGEPDMLAESFAGDLGRAFLNAFRAACGSTPEGEARGIIHRTNYYDAAMLQAVQSGCTQVLLLGSGLDTRAWRLPLGEGVTVFEVDVACAHEFKRERLAEIEQEQPIRDGTTESHAKKLAHLRGAKCKRVEVDADLSEARWGRLVADAGFDMERPAFILAEGLLMYLPDKDVTEGLFKQVRRLMAPGSWFMWCAFVSGLGCADAADNGVMMKFGCAWTFKFESADEVRDALEATGFGSVTLKQAQIFFDQGAGLVQTSSPGYQYFSARRDTEA